MKKKINTLFLILIILVLGMAVNCKAFASEKLELESKRIVLVHGGWHGSWSWYKVVDKLEERGYKVTCVELPAHGNNSRGFWGGSLLDYKKKIVETLDSLPEDKVVLVGHGTSGALVSMVAQEQPNRIDKLIFVGGVIVKNGESIAETLVKDKKSLALKNIYVNVIDGKIYFKRSKASQVVYNTVNGQDLSICVSKIGGEPLTPLLSKINLGSNFDSVPKYYIKTLQDNCVTPTYQDTLISKIQCKKVYTINSCHVPFISDPEEFVDKVGEIANVEEMDRMDGEVVVDSKSTEQTLVEEIQVEIKEDLGRKREISLSEYMTLYEKKQKSKKSNLK